MFQRTVDGRRLLLLGLTLVVAFCSIVYELIYSEMLRVLFGGTVVRYSLTIGLFLFSLGVGAFWYRYLADRPANFFRIEVALAVVGPLGLVAMVLFNSAPDVRFPLKEPLVLTASHLPVVVVGVLSGLEIPFLSGLIDSEDESFSEVLGVDYLGSLVGTVVYALVLYPNVGLVTSIFVLGLANAVAALLFAWEFDRSSRALLAVCLLVTASYAGVVVTGDAAEQELRRLYLESDIEAEYPPGQVDVAIRETRTTAYQQAVLYDRTTAATHDRPRQTDRCLRLDGQLQLCDSWAESYHRGLVDRPMAAFDEPSDQRVLLIGGGDHVAVDRLRKYGVTVDRVDPDGKFLRYARDHPYFRQYHDDAYRYDGLQTTRADAVSYLREADETYDLILLDLPGARTDEMLPLYSTEFYALLRSHLAEDGVVVTWAYSRHAFGDHHKAYMNTVAAAGFDRHVAYNAWTDRDGDGHPERGERFYMLAPGPRPALSVGDAPNAADAPRPSDQTPTWRPVPTYDGVAPNSVFDPNYDIIVDY